MLLMHGQQPSLRNPERCSLRLLLPAAPTPRLLLAFLPNAHSALRPPTNHPFAQTTQLLCPAQLPRMRTSPPPPTQPVPPRLITALAPPGQGQGGTDLCLCLAFSRAEEACFPLDIKGQKQIRERPSTGPPPVGPSQPTTCHHLVPGSRLLRRGWPGKHDAGGGFVLAGPSFWAW